VEDPAGAGSGEGPGRTRNRLMHALIEEGIQCRPVWKLNHKQKPYTACTAFEIEQAQDYEAHVLNVPCSTNLSAEDVRYICTRITAHMATLT